MSVATITILLFENVTQLDFTGPAQVLSRLPGTTVQYVAASLDPVGTDSGFRVLPTHDFATAAPADVLVVPGGEGAFDAMLDPATVDFVRRTAADAEWVTSVCTGAFVLGAAGLLAGRRAATHWSSLPMLAELGADPVAERVVRDGRLVTGGGVTSGIDFALTLAALTHGDEAAQRIQLQLEYDPHPPFATGSAATAPTRWVAAGIAASTERRGERVARTAALLAPTAE